MKYIFGISLLCILYSCSDQQLARSQDYNSFLTPTHFNLSVEKTWTEITFWQSRLQKDTGSYVNLLQLGFNYLGLFKLKGDVAFLKKGDSLIKRASAKLNQSDPNILQVLSQVAITQHQFITAAHYNQEAQNKNGSGYIHALLSFDAGMELGQYQEAKQYLSRITDPTSFDFLIRKAKYLDHQGDLEGAIERMEAALKKVEPAKKTGLYCWVLSNLADMYGHAGRTKEAYKAYLKVLAKDSANLYALKGIAWIAYSHDKNTSEAKRILQFITTQSTAPELYLTLAEIAGYEGNMTEKNKYTQHFLSLVEHPSYGAMYNKYLINAYLEASKDNEKALQLARHEIGARPTPETYSWLAWVYYQRGHTREALNIFTNYVKGRTFEPAALLKGAYILAAANQKSEAKKLFSECLKSSFELGPGATKQAEETLKNLF